ncbi:hypothetical protein NQ317_007705 [Molorchus minor]|uniref:K Homology domain-containing protein n=1 Tax=Molorchus minor TaxID=1323400 RepID=A0ABQ9JQE6_9CUCU|nr:hypothetical protein NQ317_007705 [Molorchus minor]
MDITNGENYEFLKEESNKDSESLNRKQESALKLWKEEMSQKQLPTFFTNKSQIQTNIVPLKLKSNIYWMSSVINYNDNMHEQKYIRPYEDNEGGLLDLCDTEQNDNIFLTKSGKFMTSLYVPTKLLPYIIGPKGIKLKSLQKNTNASIKVPKPNENGEVKITGETERNVASAQTQIQMIVMQLKDKLPKQVLELAPRGVTPSIFQKVEKLHLTICTLTLVDQEEVNVAKKFYKSCYEELIANLFIRNKKHYTYNLKRGRISKKQYDQKYHEKPETFDASDILEKFRNYEFGTVEFNTIHLSTRFTTGEGKYYDYALCINI